jgi:DNA polymerase-4
VSYNKFLAKLASDKNKPDGICVIPPAKGEAFVASLPVKRFHGVGPVTAAKMARLGIETGADLRTRSLEWLAAHFGSSARHYHDLARGICHRQVKADRPYKSVSAEDTFFEDLRAAEPLLAELERIGRTVWRRIEDKGLAGRTVTLKVKYQDFQIVTRSKSLDRPVRGDEFLEIGSALLKALLPPPKGIRLLGLGLHNLESPVEIPQLGLPI